MASFIFLALNLSAEQLALAAIAKVQNETNRNLAFRNRIHIFIYRVSSEGVIGTATHTGPHLPEPRFWLHLPPRF